MLLTRDPCPRLRPFVRSVWVSVPDAAGRATRSPREHVLPTGDMHLVLRLSGPPLRLFTSPADTAGHTVGHAIVGGARSVFYARDVSVPTRSVGAQLRPGAALALLGLPADALAGQHTPLDALWGDAAVQGALQRVHDAIGPKAQLSVFETLLAERLAPQPRAMHPAVAQALAGLGGGLPVRALVEASGYSHRRFITLFREATGLAPKEWQRVRRLQRLMSDEPARPERRWVALALEAGYSDQSHFNRDFLEIAGMTPQAYRRAAPDAPNHVRADFNFLQDRGRTRDQNGRRSSTSTGASDGHS
ncbi:AraC family transcriptional regulator [Variovorax sp. KK3]|uniref:helix-turn-helix domain-containing protein n=1 Tax=Variovorax sp. KK3 TaxID=1855728 RepID=UPI00097C96E7|nr:AraC family transcriptional regulator [Variovorax sp. KK3]